MVLQRSQYLDSRSITRPNVDHAPHLFVTEATGGGKGSVIRLCLLHAVESNWETVVVNPKRSGEYH